MHAVSIKFILVQPCQPLKSKLIISWIWNLLHRMYHLNYIWYKYVFDMNHVSIIDLDYFYVY